MFLLISYNIAYSANGATDEKNVPELRAVRLNPAPPVIDGDINDSAWQNKDIEFARNFIQREPDEGIAATESTLVAVLYDDDALYFAFWCFDDEPDKIHRQLVRRDRWGDSDIVTVRLDPFHDHLTGFRFDVSAAGVQQDYRLYNDTHIDQSWDGVWESGVKMQPWGWSAEIRIPYHCLRFTNKDEHTWGMNVTRYISRRVESPWWAFSPSAAGGFVSKFGHLKGLKGIMPARHIEILPYVVSGIETEPKSLGNPDGRDYLKNIGFDVKYGLSSNLILDATINPDFGQVELDRPVLNLSAYETYYGEKRPFFVEGANMFHTRYNLFYSRRIGRSPGGSIDDENNYTYDSNFDYYKNYPNATTILGAAKITGKLGSGTSIGFLNATTQEEIAEYVNTDGETLEGVVEPSANYSVLRLQQDILGKSNIGGLITLATQDKELPTATGGLDWRLLTPDGIWGFSGQAVFSRDGGEDPGYGANVELEKVAGDHIRGSIGIDMKDTKLNLNRLGYLDRNDEKGGWFWVQYRTNDDWWIFRNTWNNLNLYADCNNDGYNINKGWNINSYFEFINNWTLGGGFNMQYGEYADLETRGNEIWKRPMSWGWWASLNTDQRKKVSFNLNPGSGHARYGPWWANYIGVQYRPASNVELELGTNYIRGFDQTIWVENVDEGSIFGDLSQDEIELYFSASVTLTRDLSIQLSGQGYASGVDYENYRRYLSDENYEPYNLESRDFNYSALNSTLIIRWEYFPGSTLYAVWTRAMSETDNTINNLEVSRDLKNLFSGNAENVFLVKASYWWNI
jgi:hypothetical protein